VLKKVVTGAQKGVDQLALVAARECGLETGGFMPKGFLTIDGPRPDVAAFYGLRETDGDYPSRTRANVLAADASLILDWMPGGRTSAGTRCAFNAALKARRPLAAVVPGVCTPASAAFFVREGRNTGFTAGAVGTLHVGGNRALPEGWAQQAVIDWLKEVFELLKEVD
jgi:hypothetical protein